MVQPNTVLSLAMLHPDPPDDLRRAISNSTYKFQTDDLSEHEEKTIREFKAAARKCMQELSEQTLKSLCSVAQSIFAASEQLGDIERQHEEAMEDTFKFWEDVSKESIGKCRFTEVYDLQNSSWLGNGKWGWVMQSKERDRNRKVVVKISDIRHAAESVKEWKYGKECGRHATIVDYQNAFLFADSEKVMRTKLMQGYSDGTLKGTGNRSFPDTFVCLVQELMNCGTVQHWIDESLLHPTAMFVVMQQVADALAYMHEHGVTHNDMKPENILLHHEGRHILVKLGDLGLAEKSSNTTSDVTRFGMTSLCMATGEKYGSRRFKPESIDEFVSDIESLANESGAEGKLASSLGQLPRLLRAVFEEKTTMRKVRDDKCLQGWEFLEEGSAHNYIRQKSDAEPEVAPTRKAKKEDSDSDSPPSRPRRLSSETGLRRASREIDDYTSVADRTSGRALRSSKMGGRSEQEQEAALRKYFGGYPR